MATTAALALALLITLATNGQTLQAAPTPAGQTDIEHFIKVQDGHFVYGPDCKPFYISGWNSWEMMEASAGALELYGASLPDNTTGPAMIRGLLDDAAASGLNVVRAWAHTVSPPYALEVAPGQYNEPIFRGFDYMLDEARKRGIRMLLALTDNWQLTGGADQFTAWAGSTVHEDFFSNRLAKQLFKDHIKVVLNRVNTINGRRYLEDPTIFAWDIINEPRCYQCGNRLAEWVKEMAAWIKSIDPNHLVTVGEEGFYPKDVAQSAADPQGLQSWAFYEGQNFPVDHSDPNIDYTSIHLWVNNWQDATQDFAHRWLTQHMADARALGKPLVLEEFGAWGVGKYRDQRDGWYSLIYDIALQDACAGGPTAGALFWQLYAPGQRAPAEEGGGPGGLFGVFETDSTWKLVSNFTKSMQQLNQQPPRSGSCPVKKSDSVNVVQPPDCSRTWVHGLPDTGFEGPSCNIDIDECARGLSDCGINAACGNTNGGFTCTCFPGYQGDGKTCAITPYVAEVQNVFNSAGPGQVACNEGTNVVYPVRAPGWVPDPTGGLDRMPNSPWKGGFGSRSPVDPVQCMLACSIAPGCDSFAYNAEQQGCFLKSGAQLAICPKPQTVCTSARGTQYSCGFWETYFNVTAMGAKPVARVEAASFSAPIAVPPVDPNAEPTLVIQQPIAKEVQAYGAFGG